MAMFPIDTTLFECKECQCKLFEEIEVKSYITDNKKVSENTSTKSLKCVACGVYHNINEDYELLKSN